MSSLSLIFFFLLFTTSCHADLISYVCSKSLNPPFCNKTLESDPAARAAADLRSLGRVVVVKAKAAAGAVILAAKLSGGPIASTCIETSGDAIDYLDESLKALKKSGRLAIGDLQTKASAALSDVATCSDEYEVSHRPMPAKLKAAANEAEGIISILLVIANQL